jgi:hypothetical protein
MEIDDGEQLEAVRRRMGIDLADLWVTYFGLGGISNPTEIEAYLRGVTTFSRHEHDVLAQAINEHSIDLGLDHPAPYADRGAGGGDGDGAGDASGSSSI